MKFIRIVRKQTNLKTEAYTRKKNPNKQETLLKVNDNTKSEGNKTNIRKTKLIGNTKQV